MHMSIGADGMSASRQVLRFDGRRLLPPPADTIVFSKRKHLTITRSFIIGRLARATPLLLVLIGGAPGAASAAEPPRFVGSTACAVCHAQEYSAWQGSQHRAAMQEATDKTVLGNFASVHFTYTGVASTFFKRDGKFFVKTDGPDGKLRDYVVRHTFGVDPLQQYLIELPGDRFQALSIAWDVDKKRWFHLYPKERIRSADELHWARPAQNWNYICADCHSTALRKNYDAAADRFQTEPLAAGKATIKLDFVYDGGGPGKGGMASLSVNGKKVAEGRIAKTIPNVISTDEGADVGEDDDSPVTEDYVAGIKSRFTGKIDKVTLEVK